ncbi:O-antigen ligase family protein [Enterococcus faecalis]|uniref:O-antigen ligase family protein n=1 Tax=Enterococcus faecalis TaxID=1351 RepID=UPI001F58B8D4|nr:O-antigen ligase family protein [Enterococcus faecalis]
MERKINKLIYVLFLFMPVIESFNGYFVYLAISDIYRILINVLIVCSVVIYQKNFYKSVVDAILLVSVLIVLTLLQLLLLHGNLVVLKSDLNTIFRIMLFPMYVAYFKVAIKSNWIKINSIINILDAYSIQYMLLVIVPNIFGLGLATYDSTVNSTVTLISDTSIGNKGYFLEVNSLIAILIAMMIYSGETAWKGKFYKSFSSYYGFMLLISLGNIYALFLVATKTGIAMAILYIFFFLIRLLIYTNMLKEIKFLILLFIIIVLFNSGKLLEEMFADVIKRGMYFFNLFQGDWLRFLTSSRSEYLKQTFQNIDKSGKGLIITVIGGGYYLNFTNLNEFYKRSVTEMDWFDFYFSYGVVGVIFYINYLKNGLLNYLFLNKYKQIKIIVTVFLVYSFFAGHIIFNAMTVTILAMCYVCLDSET